MEYLKLIVTLFLCFLLRFLFIITKSSDAYLHLWLLKRYQNYGFGKHTAFNSIFNGKLPYPSFPHFIIHFFPRRHQVGLAYFLNIIYECISIFIFYLIAKSIFTKHLIITTIQFPEPYLIATLLFGTSPILFPYTSRLKSFGGRTFGNLMNIIFFGSLGICMISNNYFFIAGSVCSGILVLLSSQFGMQVMVFFSIALSICYLSAIPISALVLVFIFAFILPFLGVKDIIEFKINHYMWYLRSYKLGTTASDRNRLKDLFLYPIYLFTEPKKFFQLTFKRLSPIIAAFSLPSLVILIFWFFTDYSKFISFLNNDIIKFLFYFSLSSIIIFVLISIKWFSFLGEAERYFEYSTGAIILLFVIFSMQYGYYNLLYFMLIIHLILIFINFIASLQQTIKKAIKIEEDINLIKLVDFLNSINDGRILSIPTKLNFRLGYLSNENLKFYYHFIDEDKIDGFKRMQNDEIIYNYVKPDFDYFINTYKINTIVAEKSALRKTEKQYKINYIFSSLNLVFENKEFLVYKT